MGWAFWPWAEDNQGLLSLVALLVALMFAIFENWRANRAGHAARLEYIGLIEGLADELKAAVANLKTALDAGSHADGIREFEQRTARLALTIEPIRSAAHGDAPLALLVTQLWILSGSSNWLNISNSNGELIPARLDELAGVRAKISARR